MLAEPRAPDVPIGGYFLKGGPQAVSHSSQVQGGGPPRYRKEIRPVTSKMLQTQSLFMSPLQSAYGVGAAPPR